MGQSCSTLASQLDVIESYKSSGAMKRGSVMMKQSARKKRLAAAGSAKSRRRLQVTCDEDDGQSSTDASCEGQNPAAMLGSRTPHHTPSIAESYEILPQVAGVGITGEVRRCLHHATGDAYRRGSDDDDDGLRAVKTIDKRRVRRKDRLHREVAFLREVDHPHIVSLHDVYEDKRAVHIVTELCRGGELFDKIIEKALWGRARRSLGKRAPPCIREVDAAPILRALLSAVSYLHGRDIVHRDLKPENVLFVDNDGSNDLKLVDFGLAIRHPAGHRPLSSVVGTSYYMAPELLAGAYGRACDLWSIGAIAYMMLSGRPPFNGPTNDAIFDKIRGGRYQMEDCPHWQGVSEPARAFVRGLLVADPERRWTADEALEHPWLNGRAVEDVATGPSARHTGGNATKGRKP